MVGQAAVARRLGDLTRARALLEAADSQYREAGLPAGQPLVLAGLAWWALAAGHPDDATVFAAAAQAASARGDLAVRGAARPQLADAAQAASASGDPATQLLADTAVAAAKAIADPTASQHRQRSSRSPSSARPVRHTGLSPTSQTSPRSPPASRCRPAERFGDSPGKRR